MSRPCAILRALGVLGLAAAQVSCPAGSYCMAGQIFPCPTGTYNDQPGAVNAAACDACPAGSTTLGSGSASVSACSVSVSPTFSCVQPACSGSGCCPTGMWCTGGQVVPCPAGTEQPSPGAASRGCCSTCAENTYSAAGSAHCTTCPQSSTTLAVTGATNSSACQCSAGYTMEQGACVRLPDGDANSARMLRVLRLVPILLGVVLLGGIGWRAYRRRMASARATPKASTPAAEL